MKKSLFIVLCALMAATMISCSNKQEVNNPANQQTPEQKVLPCRRPAGLEQTDGHTRPRE